MFHKLTSCLSKLNIMNLTLFKIWSKGWKSKLFLFLLPIYLIISIPTVPLGAWTGYYLIGYFQNRTRAKNLTATIKLSMYKPFNLESMNDSEFIKKIYFIRDSLLMEGYEFSEFIPHGLDSISIRPYYNFSTDNGIVLIDFFLSCGCGEDAGKMRLIEILINTENLYYQIVNDVDIPWDYYLNPWADFYI